LIQLQPCFCFLAKASTSEDNDQQIETPCSPISQIVDMPTLVQ